MPKLVYNCAFCCSAFGNYEDAKAHEECCPADPKLQGCWSCKYVGWASDDYACEINADNSGAWCPEVTSCPKWKAR